MEDAEEREEDLKMAASAQSPSAIAISTPSTAHNSIESSCSATSTSHSRTPSGPTLANQSSASMSISVQSSHTESMSPSRGVITVQVRRTLNTVGGDGDEHVVAVHKGTEPVNIRVLDCLSTSVSLVIVAFQVFA